MKIVERMKSGNCHFYPNALWPYILISILKIQLVIHFYRKQMQREQGDVLDLGIILTLYLQFYTEMSPGIFNKHIIWQQFCTNDLFLQREVSLCIIESLKGVVLFSGKQYTGNVWKGRESLVLLCGVEIAFHLKNRSFSGSSTPLSGE